MTGDVFQEEDMVDLSVYVKDKSLTASTPYSQRRSGRTAFRDALNTSGQCVCVCLCTADGSRV